MEFEIEGKVALITGGASGIGFCFAKALLTQRVKGVAIADINEYAGRSAVEELEQEYGKSKAVFFKTDVSNKEEFEEAFKKTVDTYKNLDILINNAGICNERNQERVLAVNLNSTITGTYLGLENYLQKHRSGPEGVIVNICSVFGVGPFSPLPIYTATKFGIFGLSKAFGDEVHYNRTKVRVLILCPGATTNIVNRLLGNTLGEPYEQMLEDFLPSVVEQGSEHAAYALVKIIQKAKPGTAWIAEDGNDPYEYILPARQTFMENTLD